MDHLVRFTSAENREGHHYAEGLDAALQFVERLQNTEDATGVRVFRLREVPLEFKTYVKVEVRADQLDVDEPAPLLPVEDLPEPGLRPLVAMAADSDGHGDASGRRLFQRG